MNMFFANESGSDFWARFQDPWYLALVIIALVTIVALIVLIILFVKFRDKRLETRTLTIYLDGGQFQGSSEDLVFHAKLNSDIDISRIKPEKPGYKFTGFNVYKKYVSSTITDEGITKSLVSSEELDGMGKDVITMPDYDLHLVAKYAPLPILPAQDLEDIEYYPDFLTTEDLLADLKHLNYDRDHFPIKINFRKTKRFPDMIFIFKGKTLCSMLMPYKSLTKVYFRTNEPVENKLLSPFYHDEDINDSMNWYSLIVTYTTKPSRFIKSFVDAYRECDEDFETTEVEFDLILGSLSSTFSDPVLDRALAITEQYEKDRALDNPPSYVLERKLPSSDQEEHNLEELLTEEEKKLVFSDAQEEEIDDVQEEEESVGEVDKLEKVPQPVKEEPKKEVPPTPIYASLDDMKEEDKNIIISESEVQLIELEHHNGHYIQPKRKGRFIKWDKASKEEKRFSIKTYYKYHQDEKPLINLNTSK